MEGDDDAGGGKVRAVYKQRTPLMACVWDSPIAGDPLTLPLVESIQLVGIITNAPLFGIQIPPFIKLLPQVIPIRIRRLSKLGIDCPSSQESLPITYLLFLEESATLLDLKLTPH